MSKPTVYFSTRPFVRSHGREPRGYGTWAFAFNRGEPVFAPTSTYGEAEMWARNHALAMVPPGTAAKYAVVDVEVLP
jgi:hypothetical protein